MDEHNHNHGPKQITEAQLRKLRGQYFTVRHERVKTCGHALDSINEPTFRNCETCWFSFFVTHGELVKVTDEAIQEHGLAFVDKLRGKKYRVQFCRFMSTMNRLREDAEKLQKEKDEQAGEIQSRGSVGQGDGQGERGDGNFSTTGESSESTSTLNPDQSNFD
jgi:hypothetical protein